MANLRPVTITGTDQVDALHMDIAGGMFLRITHNRMPGITKGISVSVLAHIVGADGREREPHRMTSDDMTLRDFLEGLGITESDLRGVWD